jgi:hypothetical protein
VVRCNEGLGGTSTLVEGLELMERTVATEEAGGVPQDDIAAGGRSGAGLPAELEPPAKEFVSTGLVVPGGDRHHVPVSGGVVD